MKIILSIDCFIFKKVWTCDCFFGHCAAYVHFGRIYCSFDSGERTSCCLSEINMFVHDPENVKSCNWRITMTGNPYFSIKITIWLLVSKECDVLLIWNRNIKLRRFLFHLKKLFDLVRKWPRYLIFFLVDEFQDTLYVVKYT